MFTILVVDDSQSFRKLIRQLLSSVYDAEILTAVDGVDALRLLSERNVDIVVTDLVMPNSDGLQLLDDIQASWPGTAVVLMTAQGSELVATKALRAGAVNYVNKRDVASELIPICEQILDQSRENAEHDLLKAANIGGELRWRIPSDRIVASELGRTIQREACRIGKCDGSLKTKLGVALEEALLNAVIHGNLEVSSELRERGDGSFEKLVLMRQSCQPYCDRVLDVTFGWDETELRFVIADEGPGFDVAAMRDPTSPENVAKSTGRGILLMHTFMDEVSYNDVGNEVTLVKRYSRDGENSLSIDRPRLAVTG